MVAGRVNLYYSLKEDASWDVETVCRKSRVKGAGGVLVVDVVRRGAGDPRGSAVTVCTGQYVHR